MRCIHWLSFHSHIVPTHYGSMSAHCHERVLGVVGIGAIVHMLVIPNVIADLFEGSYLSAITWAEPYTAIHSCKCFAINGQSQQSFWFLVNLSRSVSMKSSEALVHWDTEGRAFYILYSIFPPSCSPSVIHSVPLNSGQQSPSVTSPHSHWLPAKSLTPTSSGISYTSSQSPLSSSPLSSWLYSC